MIRAKFDKNINTIQVYRNEPGLYYLISDITVEDAKKLLRELVNAIESAEKNNAMATSRESYTILPND